MKIARSNYSRICFLFCVFLFLMLQNQVFANIENKSDKSPLSYEEATEKQIKKEIKTGDIDAIKLHIENNISFSKYKNKDEFIIAAIKNKQNDILDLLLENIEVDSPSLLNVALFAKNPYAIEKLMQLGLDIYSIAYSQVTYESALLSGAIIRRANEELEVLLKNGANPNAVYNNIPLIHFAIIYNNLFAFESLIKYGADKEIKNKGRTPLEYASLIGRNNFVQVYNEYISYVPKNLPAYKVKTTFQNSLKANVVQNAVNYTKKDPKLIVVPYTKPISNAAYNKKIQNDNLQYQSIKKTLNGEQSKIYTIFEKILRANNLQYQNWRIGINIDTETVNAYAGSANLITINSSLYDSLHNNQDALAFIISHELAHLLLNHNQITLENTYKIKDLEARIQEMQYQANRQNDMAGLNNALGNHYASVGNSVSAIGYNVGIVSLNNQINNIYAQERLLELYADTEAVTLMTRAGYNPSKAIDAFNFLANIPNVYTLRSTHPDIATRINNVDNEINFFDKEEIKRQGKNNLYNSKVLKVQKSSDRVSIILNATPNFKQGSYVPEALESKYLKKGYLKYKEDDMVLAKNLFIQAYRTNKYNYIAPLYLSYINEYEYQYNRSKTSLKAARYWLKKAKTIKSYDKNVVQQEKDIKNLYAQLKGK